MPDQLHGTGAGEPMGKGEGANLLHNSAVLTLQSIPAAGLLIVHMASNAVVCYNLVCQTDACKCLHTGERGRSGGSKGVGVWEVGGGGEGSRGTGTPKDSTACVVSTLCTMCCV